jgi:hypothetical protein
MSKKSFSRRNFIKSSAASAFSFTFIPAYLTAAKSESNPMRPPSQRINLAVIGSGGMGRGTAKKHSVMAWQYPSLSAMSTLLKIQKRSARQTLPINTRICLVLMIFASSLMK